MKLVVTIGLLTTLFAIPALAQVHVKGYTRKDGTYVQPHIRSAPDGVKWNNYGSGGGNGYASPNSRDNDNDGTPNYQDHDDNNNGVTDDQDHNQYGR